MSDADKPGAGWCSSVRGGSGRARGVDELKRLALPVPYAGWVLAPWSTFPQMEQACERPQEHGVVAHFPSLKFRHALPPPTRAVLGFAVPVLEVVAGLDDVTAFRRRPWRCKSSSSWSRRLHAV